MGECSIYPSTGAIGWNLPDLDRNCPESLRVSEKNVSTPIEEGPYSELRISFVPFRCVGGCDPSAQGPLSDGALAMNPMHPHHGIRQHYKVAEVTRRLPRSVHRRRT
jgi:hypothetical protein